MLFRSRNDIHGSVELLFAEEHTRAQKLLIYLTYDCVLCISVKVTSLGFASFYVVESGLSFDDITR